MTRYPFPIAAAVVGAALLLGGCSGQAGLKALDRAARPEDKLPPGVTLQQDVKADSARLLATRDGAHQGARRAPGMHLGRPETVQWIRDFIARSR